MTLIKGPNGIVVDVAPSVASGLIGGGHAVAADADSKVEEHDEDSETATADDTEAEQGEESEMEEDEDDSTDPAKPAGNASRGDWEAYALSQGFAEEQLEGLKQGEIRALIDE